MDEAYDSPDSDGHGSLPSPSDTTYDFNELPPPKTLPSELSTLPPAEYSDLEDDDDDDNSVVVKVNRDRERFGVASPNHAASRDNSRVLAPAGSNSDSPFSKRVTKTGHRTQDENIRPAGGSGPDRPVAPLGSLLEGASVEQPAGKTPYDSNCVTPTRGAIRQSGSLASPPDNRVRSPSSTPDPVTGLPKRIVVRKNRGSPPKDLSPTAKSSGRTTHNRRSAREQLDHSFTDSDDADNESPRSPTHSNNKVRPQKISQRRKPADPSVLSGNLGGDKAPTMPRQDSSGRLEGVDFTDQEIGLLKNHFRRAPFEDEEAVSGDDSSFDSQDEAFQELDQNAYLIASATGAHSSQESHRDDNDDRPPPQSPAGRDQGRNQGMLSDSNALSANAIIAMVQSGSSATTDDAEARAAFNPLKQRDDTFEVPSSSRSEALPGGSVQHSPSAETNHDTIGSSTIRSENTVLKATTGAQDAKINPREDEEQGEQEQEEAQKVYPQHPLGRTEGLASPSEIDAAFPDNTRNNTMTHGMDNSQALCSESPLASSTPRDSQGRFSLKKLKNSRLARRMSINTPPSQSVSRVASLTELLNLPSSLTGSEYQFPKTPLRYEVWDPTSVPLEFSPLLPVDMPPGIARMDGTEPPPNSAHGTPQAPRAQQGSAWQLAEQGTRRGRSKSDPLDSTKAERSSDGSDGERMLFAPNRVGKDFEKEGEEEEGNDKNVTGNSEGEESIRQELSRDIHSKFSDSVSDAEGSDDADDDVGDEEAHNGERRHESDPHAWSGFAHDSPRSPRHLAESLHDDDDLIDDIVPESKSPEQSSLSLEDVQVRFETPTSVAGQRSKTRSLSDESLDRASGPAQDVSLQHRVLQLESYIRTLHKREAERKSELDKAERQASHWKNQYEVVRHTAEEYQHMNMDLENHVAYLEGQDEHAQENGKQDGFERLKERVALLEGRLAEAKVTQDEKEEEIGHLRSALDERESAMQDTIDELQQTLQENERAYKAGMRLQEEKLQQMLLERDAELRHLQAELDEMTHLQVEHRNSMSSRMINNDGDEWSEKSREISQYFEESFDQIITELHGATDREDLGEAVAEAEMSLRKMAQDHGYVGSLDKVSLAAFGIRNLRQQHDYLKGRLHESEERITDLILIKEGLDNNERALSRKARNLGDENLALHKKAGESEQTIMGLGREKEVLEQKVADLMKRAETLTTEAKRLTQSTDRRCQALELERDSLQSTVRKLESDLGMRTKRLEEAGLQIETQRKDISTLNNVLAESDGVHQTEISGLRQRIVQLERTISEYEQERTALQKNFAAVEIQLKNTNAIADSGGREREILATKIREAEERNLAAQAEINRARNEHTKSVEVAQTERSALKGKLTTTETELRALRARFDGLLRENAANGVASSRLKKELESRSQTDTDIENLLTAYKRSLSRIVTEMDDIPWGSDDEDPIRAVLAELQYEDLAEPLNVASVVYLVRKFPIAIEQLLEKTEYSKDLEVKNARLKGAIKKWSTENGVCREREEKLSKENAALLVKLKAERKQNDDKIAQLILALRR